MNAARDKLQRALALYQASKDWADAADILHQLAAIDLHAGDHGGAYEKLKRTLELRQQNRDQLGRAAA